MRRPGLLLLALACAACGARGAPLPPLRPVPPPVTDLRVAQVGTDAEITFPPPPATIDVGDGPRPVDRIEILVLTERYPAITPELLATSLERERRERLEAARSAAEAVAREAAARAAQQQGEQAGAQQEQAAAQQVEAGAAAEPAAAAAEEAVLTEEERLLRKVPRDAMQAWRTAGLTPEAMLDGARRLDEAVDRLWDALGLPTAIIDLRRPPELPDPTVIIERARRVARTVAYERELEPTRFVEFATVAASVPTDELDPLRAGDRIRYIHPVGIPANEPVRTRYYFGVRSVMGKRLGAVARVVSLAPVPVPVAPSELVATVVEKGVSLAWSPPAGDLWGRLLAADELRYNVRRRPAGQPWYPDAPLNPEPLEVPSYLDQEVTWGRSYEYEVRALSVSATRPGQQPESAPVAVASPEATTPVPVRKESAPADSGEVAVIDTFPPPAVSGLVATRSGARVTLRWQPVEADDLDGYRVYRRRVPAEGEQAEEQAGAAAEPPARVSRRERRAQRGNPLVAAGWEMLTATPITETRYVDPTAEPAISWVYLVEPLDKAGNGGEPATVTVEAER